MVHMPRFMLALAPLALTSAVTQLPHTADRDVQLRNWESCFKPQKVLLVDVRGPTPMTGDGVRTMGMVMDLLHRSCSDSVATLEVMADFEDMSWKFAWGNTSIATAILDGFANETAPVKLWNVDDLRKGDVKLSDFDRIIIGAKLDLATDGKGMAVKAVLTRLKDMSPKLNNRTEIFWDDEPFIRCKFKPDADEICKTVPGIVALAANVSHKMYFLSRDDQRKMDGDMQKAGIPLDGIDAFELWPMRLSNMVLLNPGDNLKELYRSNKYLVPMIGNKHAVNNLMVDFLFNTGIITALCDAIKSRNSPVRILFMGGLAADAQEAAKNQANVGCINITTGFVDADALENQVFPVTRAFLNPFFKDVDSGISVKNFEAISRKIPVITHDYGLRSLSDEIPDCSRFPMPLAPEDPKDFVSFFVENVVDDEGYTKFSTEFTAASEDCIAGQTRTYQIGRAHV